MGGLLIYNRVYKKNVDLILHFNNLDSAAEITRIDREQLAQSLALTIDHLTKSLKKRKLNTISVQDLLLGDSSK
jgi:hypothetical protein